MFVGREYELEELKRIFNSSKRASVLVYGKRRVGKSTLIAKAASFFKGTIVNHTCIKSSYSGNLAMFARSISFALNLPEIRFNYLSDAFELLKSRNEEILIILDEYQYFKASLKKDELDSQLQVIIDTLPDNIKLVICGSYITVMKELLEEENPLFGRFSNIFSIEEFDYYDAAKFFLKKSTREKISFYGIFGGSPFVLSKIDYEKSLAWNIKNLLLKKDSILWTHIESVMLKEIQKSFDTRILYSLGNGKKKYSELISILGNQDTGNLDKQLKNLASMDTIKKIYPINMGSNHKLQFYEISDNLMRFYFKYIFGNETRIVNVGEENYYKNEIESSIDYFIDDRFEEMVRQFFRRRAQIEIDDVKDIGTYWYNDSQNKVNGEFDCVVERKHSIDIYEVKNHKRKMTIKGMEIEANKMRGVKMSKPINIGFVCSGGFENKECSYMMISGEEIFSDKYL